MGFQKQVMIGNDLTFTVVTHTPETGAAVDADSVPTYRIYEEETATPILTGSMAKLDDANTTGFYSAKIACTGANGFENGKSYTILVQATVNMVTGAFSDTFRATTGIWEEEDTVGASVYGGVSVLVSTIITAIRFEINDSDSTRFSDTVILNYIKQAIRRAKMVAIRNGLQFAKAFVDISTVVDQAYVSMPGAMDIFLRLYRTATYTEVPLKTEWQWEEMSASSSTTTGQLQGCCLDYANGRILLKATPAAIETLRLWYYPMVDPTAYTTGSTMPWGGRLNDAIVEYAALRLKNIDEMDTTMDQQLLTDFENQIITTYQPLAPTVVQDGGWT